MAETITDSTEGVEIPPGNCSERARVAFKQLSPDLRESLRDLGFDPETERSRNEDLLRGAGHDPARLPDEEYDRLVAELSRTKMLAKYGLPPTATNEEFAAAHSAAIRPGVIAFYRGMKHLSPDMTDAEVERHMEEDAIRLQKRVWEVLDPSYAKTA